MSYTTKKSLLAAIQQGDEISWKEFYETYRPLIILRGRDYHLTSDELEDLCQIVVLDIFKLGTRFHYDASKGRFRDYLRKVITHNAIDVIRKRPVLSYVEKLPDETLDTQLEDRWNEEWRGHLLTQALEILRQQVEPATYQAFELYAIKGSPAEDVAKFLGISVDMVYVAKSRVLPKLKGIIRNLQEE